MNTFFGEVNELNSRAIYWSDNESDEESDESQSTDGLNVVVHTNDNFNTNCNTIYMSLAKNEKTIEELTQIGSIAIIASDDNDHRSDSVANIYAVSKTSIWIQLNANYPTLKNHLLVKTITSLMNELLRKLGSDSDPKTKPLVCLICKDLVKDDSSDDIITYLSNNDKNLSAIPAEVKRRALLAPKMLNNLVESSVFQFCTVFRIPCIALLLPEFQSNSFNKHFIPKQILDSVQHFNRFTDSNIFI